MSSGQMTAAVLALAMGIGCGGPKQVIQKDTSAPKRPDWLAQKPERAGFLFVVGVKSGAKTLEEGKQQAHQNATVQVANVIGAQIKSEFESRSSTRDGEYASEHIQARTAAVIQNLQPVDTYYEKTTRIIGGYFEEKYDVYVLQRFSLAAADEERQRQVAEQQSLASAALKNYESSKQLQQQGNLREAWVLIGQAHATLSELPRLTQPSAENDATVGDLLSDVSALFRTLEQRVKSVQIVLEAKDDAGRHLSSSFSSHLSKALQSLSWLTTQGGAARFVLKLEYSTQVPQEKVMNQTVGHIHYAASVRDTWSDSTHSAGGQEVKGFGRTAEGALGEAAEDAAKRIAKALAASLEPSIESEITRR